MRITDGQGPIQPADRPNRRIERSGSTPGPTPRAADPARLEHANAPSAPKAPVAPKDSAAIHQEDALRESVARLIESGDISSTDDSSVRRVRVDEAKRKLEAGAYNQNDIIGGIVDRLLGQWKI